MYNSPVDTDKAHRIPLKQDAWELFAFENLEVIRLHLESGDSMENHINDWRIVFYVLEGSGSLNVAGNVIELIGGQSIAVKAGEKRFWSNTGSCRLELLVVKTKDTE